MGPTGNQQGGHYFMSLTTGERLVRSRWTPLPIPRDAQTRVNNFGSKQKMPKSLTFSDRHGQELRDNLDDIDEWGNEDDDTYEYEENVDDDELTYDVMEDVVADSVMDTPNVMEDVVEDTDDVSTPLIEPPTLEDYDNSENTGVVDGAPMSDAGHSVDPMEDAHEATGRITGVEESSDEDDVSDGTTDCDNTEEAEYEKAERLGTL